MQPTGNLIVDGVVQIVVAHVGHNPIDGERVPDLMRNVSKTLIECVHEAAKAFGEPLTTPAPSRTVIAASAPVARLAPPRPKVRAIEQAPAQPAETPAPVVEAPPVEAAPAPVAEAAPEPVTEAAPVEEAAPVDPFAHLSRVPAVPISESITNEGVICLFDGQPRKMLHRHLRAKYGMEPEQYRTFWNLPSDYPMTAPNYSDEKRIVAVAQGLGTAKIQRKTRGKQGQGKSSKAKDRQRQSA